MKFLLDSNVLIPVEPTSVGDAEPTTPAIAEFLGAASQGKHQVLVHPAAQQELSTDKSPARRQLRQTLLTKYQVLESPPEVPPDVLAVLGTPAPGSNDEVDHLHLAAVHRDAVDFLVTYDRGIAKKANRLGLLPRICTPDEALATIRGLFPKSVRVPPAVQSIKCHELDEKDPIFDSLRIDYAPNFDPWLVNCKREHRSAWVIRGDERKLSGVAIINPELSEKYGLKGKLLKLCTFKIADHAYGNRFGELLLKPVLSYACDNGFDQLFVTTLPKQSELISLFERLGFTRVPVSGAEFVFAKRLRYEPEEYQRLDGLEFHIRFGPRHVKFDGVAIYVVPIQPQYFSMLFPDLEEQGQLFPGKSPFGNSIQKAYLCRAPVRKIKAGDVVLFYQSRDDGSVLSYGVVEQPIASTDAETIARAVGKRTVYSREEIAEMCSEGEVLALLFRHAGAIPRRIQLQELIDKGVLKGVPQTISSVRSEGVEWLRKQIER